MKNFVERSENKQGGGETMKGFIRDLYFCVSPKMQYLIDIDPFHYGRAPKLDGVPPHGILCHEDDPMPDVPYDEFTVIVIVKRNGKIEYQSEARLFPDELDYYVKSRIKERR